MKGSAAAGNLRLREDVWIPTTCGCCYASCPIRVRRLDGVPVRIDGEPRAPLTDGRVCGKGVAGLSLLSDPNRVNAPLKRTNPEKGIGVDPGWKEISWEEALTTIANKLREVYQEDPRQLRTTVMPAIAYYSVLGTGLFGAAFGTPNISAGSGGIMCGNAAHLLSGMIYGAWSFTCDWTYCDYVVLFGASKGHGAGHGALQQMRGMAEGRRRGMRTVVFDPVRNFAGGKAKEWVPIIPGTDGAVALAMVNIILNELRIWDDVFIKTKTNGPYLVGPDQLYVRDKASNKPLVWDLDEAIAKTWDDPSAKNVGIEGSFEVQDTTCAPAFHLLREHVRKYTAEYASQVSSVPAVTIRRVAGEFARAARIGSTISIRGKTFPYRPAAALAFRGVNGHMNAFNSLMAIHLLNLIVGSADVPGGAVGWPTRCFGYPATGRPKYEPRCDPVEGMLIPGWWWGESDKAFRHAPWPMPEPSLPEASIGLGRLYPWVNDSPFYFSSDRQELWQKVGLDYRPKVWISHGGNVIMSTPDRESVAASLKEFSFVVMFEIFLSESTDFADIVLPDASYLETLSPLEHIHTGKNGPSGGATDWYVQIRQPVVEPQYGRRMAVEVLLELAERVDPLLLEKYYSAINQFVAMDERYKLKSDHRHTWPEIVDRILKNYFGDDHDLEWFAKNGGVGWPKRPEEAYWRYEVEARVPIYCEFIKRTGDNLRDLLQPRGINLDWRHFTPLPEHFSCPPHEVEDPEFDLYAVSYRDILHGGTVLQEVPWIDEASRMNPYTYNVSVHENVAKKKHLKDGDAVWIESQNGRKVKGTVKVVRGIHPEVIGMTSHCGHWSRHLPIAAGKGSFVNDLLDIHKDCMDPVSLSLEAAAKVRLTKCEDK